MIDEKEKELYNKLIDVMESSTSMNVLNRFYIFLKVYRRYKRIVQRTPIKEKPIAYCPRCQQALVFKSEFEHRCAFCDFVFFYYHLPVGVPMKRHKKKKSLEK